MDLNVMLREQAKSGLQAQLDAAVTNGDTEAARKAADALAKLEVSTAPKAPPFGDAEIRSELNKLEWFGVDPKKTAKVLEFGKTMDPKKFPSAEAFAAAAVKAVEEEFKPATAGGPDNDGDDEPGGEDPPPAAKKPPAARRTDGPEDLTGRGRRGPSGPWTKVSEAPPEVQAEIRRQAAKLLPANASEDAKKQFTQRQLSIHYAIHQKGKK